MPPKTMPMPAQPAPLQDSLGVNPEYLLPHQREQYRRALQTVTDHQSHKAKEPNNSQLDAAIAEARGQLATLAAAAAQHEKLYPTPESFQQFVNEQRQNLARRNEGTNPNVTPSPFPRDHVLILSAKNTQLTSRIKEIDASLKRPDISEADQTKLRAEYTRNTMEQEVLKNLFYKNPVPATIAAAAAAVQAGVSLVDPTPAPPAPPTPPVSQSQTGTPTVRPAPATSSISMASQSILPLAPSMGQLPRPSVNTAVPAPRPTLSGGYAVGNPLLGTTSPAGMPHAFHLSQDGDTRLLSKRKLQDLVKSIDPDERLEPDVEELLMEVADEFIDSVLQQSCKIARHRKGQMLEVKDVQLHLERNWNIRIPGYTSDEVKNVKKYVPTPAHGAKVTAVSQAKAMTRD